jgi:hypothetical protein
MRNRNLLLLALASTTLLGARPLFAQPGDHDHDHHGDHHPPPPPPGDGPTEAPPPPREERQAARAGFEWVAGHWDWRHKKWEWVAGRWEKEHPGKHWTAGHWDHAGATWTYTEGTWADAGGAPPPPPPDVHAPPPPPPGPIAPPHEWHLDRPTVSSYWPTKGKVGTRVVIHGKNFPADAQVLWGPEPVVGAKVKPDEIKFDVPANAQSATILIKRGEKHDLIVGNFEVANFDGIAEAKRLEAERVKAAQAAWAESQAKWAKDQDARQAAADAAWKDLESNREKRRADRIAELRQKWKDAFLADPDTQSELTLHAQRLAELARAKEVAQISANQKLGVRIDVATTRETERHDNRMAALETAFNGRGGTP